MDTPDFNRITDAVKDSFTSLPKVEEELTVKPISEEELRDCEPLICPVTGQDLDPDSEQEAY